MNADSTLPLPPAVEPPSTTTVTTEWPTNAASYDLVGKIGQGAFATVWKARIPDSNTGAVCAVKVLNLDHVDTNLAEIRLEVQAMRLSSHPNVLTCHTAFCNDTNLWLVTPLMTKGSSLHSLQEARRALSLLRRTSSNESSLQQQQQQLPVLDPNFMEAHILYILYETLLGLEYIHNNGQIHRDIKAGNILLDCHGNVKIADFGVSGWLVNAGSQQEKAKTFVGTPCWMAPEVMEQVHGYDYKADIWSLGITALELAKGYAPYAKYPPMKVLILTIQQDPPSLDSYIEEEDVDDDDDDDALDGGEEFSKAFRALVSVCLQKNPAKRPTCQELLASKYLTYLSDANVRQAAKDNIRTQVCDLVRDVGAKDEDHVASSTQERLPGNSPISIVLSQENKDRPAGTTWVFADGSQVLSSTAGAHTGTVDDVMAELDEFGKQTGGEHYDRESSRSTDQLANTGSQELQSSSGAGGDDNGDNDEDDLNDFMDEFELNTAGEDFRR